MTPTRRNAPSLLLLPLLAAALCTPLAYAATITGTVSDRTTNKVAANEAVVLIGFGQGMQEVARTTTDAHGHYSIQSPDEGTHLIRVDHQKATYFQPAPPGAHSVDVDVYDVAEKVKGITTEADVLSMQTDQGGLHIVENYFVRNDSKPAMTQLSKRAYEIYLPAGVKIEASAAMGPAGMPVASSPIPVGDPSAAGGDPGHYAFVFPIRPGETRFQVSYHLPYSGSLALSRRVALPTENFVVMLPKSMQFTPKGSEFQTVPDSVTSQTFVRKGVPVEQPVEFTVAGTGSMPREAQGAGPEGQGGAAQAAAASGQGGTTAAQPDAGADNRPGGGLGPPIDTPDPLHKYKWWILSGLALVLVVAAAWLLRKPSVDGGQAVRRPEPSRPAALQPSVRAERGDGYAASAPASAADSSFLGTLKEAVFALETERLSGRTSEEEYRQLKASLEVVLRQALERATAKQ